ncbi:fungal pheromone STE3G-protein-coupled receptor [Peniophora sp. CONT]|nr:fungal pheromone STE3G-protein-coupled receptor [Peniophora sp. CONT]
MLLLVLINNFVRHSWNVGVASLCFWLCLGNLTSAVNAIIWSDNAVGKLYVYCDIVSHLDMINYVVKPMATFIITRRLYLIASLESSNLPSKPARRRALVVEWMLGLFFPLLIAGPVYYVHQGFRFEVDEGFGCTSASQTSVLELLTIGVWTVIPPLVSIYISAKALLIFYRQSRDAHSSSSTRGSGTRTNYIRVLILASIDLLLTLPIGIVNIVLGITSWRHNFPLPFYWGWTFLHSDWEPLSVSYAEFKASGSANFALYFFNKWTSPVLAFTIFGLFGVTSEARASYWRIMYTMGERLGWKPSPHMLNGSSSLSEIEFGPRGEMAGPSDLEMGCGWLSSGSTS